MKLYLKQRVFSWRDRFFVKDETGADRYSVEGEIFTLGKKLHIYDANGSEAAFIRQKVMSWMPRYFIEIGGREAGQVVKEFTLLRPKYHLTGFPWRFEGDFWAHEYSLNDENNGRTVMRMSKQWFSWGDSYELDITRDEEVLPCLCVALAVDCAVAQNNN